MHVIISFDGSCWPNPGPMKVGYVIEDKEGKVLLTHSQDLHKQGTNNQAEYEAAIMALDRALALGATRAIVRTDSQLVVNQVKGKWKVGKKHLLPFLHRVQERVAKFTEVKWVWVPREDNTEADALATGAATSQEAPNGTA